MSKEFEKEENKNIEGDKEMQIAVVSQKCIAIGFWNMPPM